ncbi:GNAT family N-acetyltransferase [Bordetella muralis]|jgi:GNAT superfamily N-acetyltransferase|uniref:GNAT family N-acetyltransferase n=1 Tax=Bordetella muralis TaxID=1649130 RepID=UPI0039F0ED29
MSDLHLRHLESDQDYQAGFVVMRELRPHLTGASAFTAQVRRQAEQGYRLLAAWRDEQIQGLAGYRLQENLIYGRFLYLDDLITTGNSRRHRVGATLIDSVRDEARRQGCAHFVLDTGLANALGQRFYFRQGLLATGLHFGQQL